MEQNPQEVVPPIDVESDSFEPFSPAATPPLKEVLDLLKFSWDRARKSEAKFMRKLSAIQKAVEANAMGNSPNTPLNLESTHSVGIAVRKRLFGITGEDTTIVSEANKRGRVQEKGVRSKRSSAAKKPIPKVSLFSI